MKKENEISVPQFIFVTKNLNDSFRSTITAESLSSNGMISITDRRNPSFTDFVHGERNGRLSNSKLSLKRNPERIKTPPANCLKNSSSMPLLPRRQKSLKGDLEPHQNAEWPIKSKQNAKWSNKAESPKSKEYEKPIIHKNYEATAQRHKHLNWLKNSKSHKAMDLDDPSSIMRIPQRKATDPSNASYKDLSGQSDFEQLLAIDKPREEASTMPLHYCRWGSCDPSPALDSIIESNPCADLQAKNMYNVSRKHSRQFGKSGKYHINKFERSEILQNIQLPDIANNGKISLGVYQVDENIARHLRRVKNEGIFNRSGHNCKHQFNPDRFGCIKSQEGKNIKKSCSMPRVPQRTITRIESGTYICEQNIHKNAQWSGKNNGMFR